MDSRQGQLPAGRAERLAAWRKPERGATLRTDVLAYLALLFQLHQRRVYKSVPGVEPVGYLVLYVPGPDGVVLPLDVDLNGVPDLCGMRHGVPLRRRRRGSGDRRRRCALRSSSESLVRYSHWDTAHHGHSRGRKAARRVSADASRVTATVTATAATCDNQQR